MIRLGEPEKDWMRRQDWYLRSPAYETGGDDWTPLLRDNIYGNIVTIEKHIHFLTLRR